MIRCFSFATLVLLSIFNIDIMTVQGRQRIVGGDVVTDRLKYPFFATPASNYVCGASLIHGDILVTAAHCGELVWKDGIWLGGTHYYSKQKTYYSTAAIIIHPKYNATTQKNDIALIKVNGFINQSSTMQYGLLNFNRSLPHVGDMMTVIGYGRTTEEGEVSHTLMSVDVQVDTYAKCNNYYTPFYNFLMLCQKGLLDGGKDSCYGDSGGPVFLKNTTTIVGIVSYGNGCGRPDTPSVNTRVSSFSNWIQKRICRLSSNPASACV
jgi:secreted trypsin-like serine protease